MVKIVVGLQIQEIALLEVTVGESTVGNSWSMLHLVVAPHRCIVYHDGKNT